MWSEQNRDLLQRVRNASIDCLDVSFLPDGILDRLPQPSTIGRTRVGGIDLDKPRTRTALKAVTALAASPQGFTVADVVAKVHAMTGRDTYTIRQAAYDLRKLRGHDLVVKPGHARRHHVPPQAARTITALIVLRQEVIGPILAGVRVPRRGRPPPIGPPSTVTTRPSASACTNSSMTSQSPPQPHRQHFADQNPQAPSSTCSK